MALLDGGRVADNLIGLLIIGAFFYLIYAKMKGKKVKDAIGKLFRRGDM